MTHSKLDIDSILAQYITRETHKGSVNRVRILAKQALLEAFEQSLPIEAPPMKSGEVTKDSTDLDKIIFSFKKGYNAYRNEAIKVIRGNDE